ncbi:MAG: response regulator [bacterium]|nr:response regulator [bacterium]
MNNPRILIVDDRPSNLKALRVRLTHEGYDLLEATNGPDALDRVEREHPDLVLLDVMMPKMDGFEVCRRIKARTHFIPVVLITALADQDARVTGIEAGADDFLNKPVDPGELKARVKALLHTRALYDELQHRYEDLKQLEVMRETLTQMIVHDLRNPLAAILGYAKILKRKNYVSQEERAQNALHTIDMCGQNLLDMITAMLDLAKLEAGEMQLNLESVDLFEVLHDVDTGMKSLLERKNLILKFDLPGDLACLHVDRESLRRILVNILGNAVKFSPTGGCIHIGARQKDHHVCISITDQGPGIPPEYRERIFEKFGQVESQQSGQTYATGLGLAFCKMAVEAHGGNIGVESEIGNGSTFYFRLPVEKSA